MHERRRVDHLDDRCQNRMSVGERAARLGRKQDEGRSQPFAADSRRNDRRDVARTGIDFRARRWKIRSASSSSAAIGAYMDRQIAPAFANSNLTVVTTSIPPTALRMHDR